MPGVGDTQGHWCKADGGNDTVSGRAVYVPKQGPWTFSVGDKCKDRRHPDGGTESCKQYKDSRSTDTRIEPSRSVIDGDREAARHNTKPAQEEKAWWQVATTSPLARVSL